MWKRDEREERRRTKRVDLHATATLVQRGGQVGRFTVQNLSAGGALLTGGSDVLCSAPLRVVLELPNGEALTVGAHVRRKVRTGNLVALAVAFRHISEASEDRIQDALLALLDRAYRVEHPAVLIVEPGAEARDALWRRIDRLGRRTLLAAAPLGALRMLDDPTESVETVLARKPCLELLEHVAENQPCVRPVLLVDDPAADPSVGHPRVERCRPEQLEQLLA